MTPLHMAAEAGKDTICKLLLSKGVKLNIKDIYDIE